MGLGDRFWNWFKGLPGIRRIVQWAEDHPEAFRWPTADEIREATDLIYTSPEARVDIPRTIWNFITGERPLLKVPERQEEYRRFLEDPSSVLGEILSEAAADPRVVETAQVAGATVFDTIMTMAIGGAERLSPDIQERIRRFLGTVVLLSATPRFAGVLAELLSLGQIETVGQIFRDAYFNLGLGFVTWQMTSPLIDAGIGQELRRQANEIFRPERFTWSQMRDLLALGQMSIEEVRSELASLGWRDSDIERVIALAFRTLSESALYGLWEKGIVDESFVGSYLRKLGYGAQEIELLLKLHRPEVREEAKRYYIGTLRKAFRQNLITESEFRQILSQMRLEDTEINLEVELIKLEQEEEYRSLAQGQIKKAFMENVLDEVTATKYLMDLDFGAEQVNVILETWKREKVPPERQLNRSTITQAYIANVIDKDKAMDLLQELGYAFEKADLILSVADTYKVEEPRDPSVGALMTALRHEIIDLDFFVGRMQELGYSDVDIALYQTLATFAPPGRAVDLSKSEVLRGYGDWVIPPGLAHQLLISLGYDPEEASILIAMEDARRSQKDVIKGYRFGVIGDAELVNQLIAAGVDPDAADRIALEERQRRAKWNVIESLRGKILTPAQAAESLAAIGYTPDEITAIMDEEFRRERILAGLEAFRS